MAMVLRASGNEPVLAEFPFELREGFIWLKVTARESSTNLHFILDSGAAVSTLNAESARRLGLRGGSPVTVKGVGSSTVGSWPQRLNARVASVPLPKNYLVVDLCHLQASCACPIDGLVGADFFDGKIVQVDFAREKIRLLRSAKNLPGEVIPLKKRGDIWQAPLRVNGSATGWFRLDTGCATALQWVNDSAPQPLSSRVTVALAKMSLPITETKVQLGTATYSNVLTCIHASEIFPGEAGLVGVGLLSQFPAITLDGKASRLILAPALTR